MIQLTNRNSVPPRNVVLVVVAGKDHALMLALTDATGTTSTQETVVLGTMMTSRQTMPVAPAWEETGLWDPLDLARISPVLIPSVILVLGTLLIDKKNAGNTILTRSRLLSLAAGAVVVSIDSDVNRKIKINLRLLNTSKL